jgi:hypothetical protein
MRIFEASALAWSSPASDQACSTRVLCFWLTYLKFSRSGPPWKTSAVKTADNRAADWLVEISFDLLVFRQLAHFNHTTALRLAC